ncbi:hypothetical protein NLI96_g11172 [Meripilus lineatus]|uniref:Uncharacterized protein n=1 Tax=Meripilus lineatus TaxID=2056292 RepID=A0AAD5USK7_9APHY|nr:hypothetical protein NLI96_g11172 [Physisporinus lineatus]
MDPTAIVNTGLTPTISLWEYVRNRYSIRLNLTQSEEALAEATQLIYVILHTEEECARYPPERLREMQEWYNELSWQQRKVLNDKRGKKSKPWRYFSLARGARMLKTDSLALVDELQRSSREALGEFNNAVIQSRTQCD